MPGFRNRRPIRASEPIPSQTSLMSAPTASQIFATALMKEIFVARNAFEACLISSALFVLVTIIGGGVLAPFGFDPGVEKLATAFWMPRVSGSAFGAAVWAMLGFFNGVSRPRVTVFITALTAIANIIFNDVFIFHLGLGVAGSGWAADQTLARSVVGLVPVTWKRTFVDPIGQMPGKYDGFQQTEDDARKIGAKEPASVREKCC